MTTIITTTQSVNDTTSSVVIEEPTLASERLVEVLQKQEAEQQETVSRIASRLKVVFFIFIICVGVVAAVAGLIMFNEKIVQRRLKPVPSASSTKTVNFGHSETPAHESIEVSSKAEKAAEPRKSDVSSSQSSEPSGTSRHKKRKTVHKNDIRKRSTAKQRNVGTSPSSVRLDSPEAASDRYGKQVDLTAFYEPVGSSKKTYKRRRTRRGRSGRYAPSSAADTLSVKERSNRIKERIRLIEMLVHRYKGKIDRILDYNSTYYKVKMFIPPAKLKQFQQALSREATSATFTVQKEESTPEKTCLVFEFYTQ